MNIDYYSRKFFSINRFPLLVLVAVCLQSAQAAEPGQLDEQLAAYTAQIEELEFESGPYHNSLIEPLESMIQLLQEKGDYEQVAAMQNRQLQVMRTALGFEHPDLIPAVQAIIANQKLLGNWQEISDNLEHIRHLQASQNNDDPALLLAAINDQIAWLHGRIAIGTRENLVSNFFKARALCEEMEDLATDRYAKDSIESVPWLYKRAYNSYQLVQFLTASNGVGSSFVERLTRREGTLKLDTFNRHSLGIGSFSGPFSNVPVVDGKLPFGYAYFREGYSQVNKIKNILQQGDNLEAQAMAELYLGDFQLLSGRGLAIRSYRDAQKMLLEAGVDEEEVRWFFQRPMIIPMEQFHSSFKEAVAEQKRRLTLIEPVSEEKVHLGLFTAWHKSLSSTPLPMSADALLPSGLPYKTVDLSFSVSSRGKVSSLDSIESASAEREVERISWRKVKDIRFRPAIIDGKAKRVKDVLMRYRLVEE